MRQKKLSFVPCWLESFFFIQRVDWDFYFPISECWNYCIGENTQNINMIIRIVLSYTVQYVSHFLSGTWNKHAEYTLLLRFCFLFVCFVFVSCYLHGTGRFASHGPIMLFNFLWFCLYCMYFFKGFWGRPQKYRSACERGRTCIFTGYPPPLQLQSGLLCTCITEAPNKTHCGWLVTNLWAPSVCVRLQLQPGSKTIGSSVVQASAPASLRPLL